MLSKFEFDNFMAILKNKLKMSSTINKIKTIVIGDPYLVLQRKDVNNFIIRTDISDFGIGAIFSKFTLILI
jgi:hypothetical protein